MVSRKNGASASTPRLEISGTSAACHVTTQVTAPKAISSRPNRLAGRRAHQYKPMSVGAATR